MKINKLPILVIITTFALCWEWPWSSSSETNHDQGIELPKGDHSILYEQSNLIWKGQKAIGDSHTGNIKIKTGNIIIDKNGQVKGIFQSVKRNGNLLGFDGDLTIKNISHPISFTANISESEGKIIAQSSLVFDRSIYDVKYGSGTFFEDLGDYLILDDINLEVTLAIEI